MEGNSRGAVPGSVKAGYIVSPEHHSLVNRLRLHDIGDDPTLHRHDSRFLSVLNPVDLSLTKTYPQTESLEEYDFSDVVLQYINNILMEEDMEDKACMYQQSAALQAAEKSFYDVIGEKYPPSPDTRAISSSSTISSSRDGYADSPMSSMSMSSDRNDPLFSFEEDGLRGKKNRMSSDSNVSSEMFDMVLLNGSGEAALRESLQSGVQQNQNADETLQSSTGNGKTRGKKQRRKKRDVVDMRTLLTLCAQAVAADDRRSAHDLLMQIRRHSSATGDGMQRMAHYFVQGLEARLSGLGTQIYASLMDKATSAAEILKAYHLFLAACPFKKISNFFSNKTIMNLADKATTKLHIIDFGIMYGFQWPCLIERLSSRPCGPPKLRITGIDLPQPGFRPAERVEETGRRLENYAKKFNVPFEFNAIAQRWETIKLEDLKLDKDEIVVVNCMYRLRNLLDETVVMDSPRDSVLNLIKKMKPNVFVLGIVNGAYNAPFFITRFREALFHYSALFDMLEANVPRDIPERTLIEREIIGREAMNVIACEGSERIERPDTYKQCQVRNQRAGFCQLPLNEEIKDMAKQRVRSYYHKDFVIDEDSQWLLQGWKGRILYALSTWTPTCSNS